LDSNFSDFANAGVPLIKAEDALRTAAGLNFFRSAEALERFAALLRADEVPALRAVDASAFFTFTPDVSIMRSN